MIETGIMFGEVHSFHDLNLILAPFVLPPAKPKTNYIAIPGGNGTLDLTEAGGETKFNDRELKFTFSVNPSEKMTFEEKQTQVSNALNGRRFERITIEKDPDYFFTGRCTVDEHNADKNLRQIVVKATVKPYKMRQIKTVASFDLTNDVQTVNLRNGRKSVVPTITCTDHAVIVFGGITCTIEEAGTYKVLDIYLTEGDNTLMLSGAGTITFEYQEGDL